jgi:cytoskeletal protein CcmA (bactofilin family)
VAPRQIDVRVHGAIRHAGSLSVGPEGAVHGDLHAAEIIVRGEVRGDLFASERIRLEAGARVFGDLYAPRVGLEPGAQLRGRLHMRSAETARTLDESGVEGILAG